MEIPQNLRYAIEKQIENINKQELIKNSENISNRYRNENNGMGTRLLTNQDEAIAYSVTRMPATYGAVFSCIEYIKETYNILGNRLLDVGAGTGAASWAISEIVNISEIVCIEREKAMIDIAKNIMQSGSNQLKNAKWIQQDISNNKITEKADIVVTSYVLNELSNEIKDTYIENIWNATDELLLIIEPGTKIGYSNILRAREILLKLGANICAPCTHENVCPISENDWCHFSCRVPRSKSHRQTKGAELSYEDEKYSYIAVTRKKQNISGMRIVRYPQIFSGYSVIDTCSSEGIKQIKYSKKDGDTYKKVKKIKWGDLWKI